MKLVFLGFTIPQTNFQRLAETDVNLKAATQNFGWSVTRALALTGTYIELLSAEPTTNFPRNSRIFIAGSGFEETGIRGRLMPFINILGVKHVTRGLAATFALTRSASSHDVILIHGVHSPFLIAAQFEKLRAKKQFFVILTDPPGYAMQNDALLVRVLKKLDRRLVRMLVRRASGVITLTPDLAAEVAPGVPSLVMEGIAPSDILPSSRLARPVVPRVVYAGGLRTEVGVLELLKAADYPGRTWSLEIFGEGPQREEMREYIRERNLKGVTLHGQISRDALLREYSRTTLLVSPRPPSADFVRYSFPSKILEYLASDVPVMSTRLPTFPPEYHGHLYWCGPSASDMRIAINKALSLPDEVRREKARAAQRFILEERGEEAQGERMIKFIQDHARFGHN